MCICDINGNDVNVFIRSRRFAHSIILWLAWIAHPSIEMCGWSVILQFRTNDRIFLIGQSGNFQATTNNWTNIDNFRYCRHKMSTLFISRWSKNVCIRRADFCSKCICFHFQPCVCCVRLRSPIVLLGAKCTSKWPQQTDNWWLSNWDSYRIECSTIYWSTLRTCCCCCCKQRIPR